MTLTASTGIPLLAETSRLATAPEALSAIFSTPRLRDMLLFKARFVALVLFLLKTSCLIAKGNLSQYLNQRYQRLPTYAAWSATNPSDKDLNVGRLFAGDQCITTASFLICRSANLAKLPLLLVLKLE